MALSYSNTVGNPSANLALSSSMSSPILSPAALANARAKGLGSGLSVIPSGSSAGQVTSIPNPVKPVTPVTPVKPVTPVASPVLPKPPVSTQVTAPVAPTSSSTPASTPATPPLVPPPTSGGGLVGGANPTYPGIVGGLVNASLGNPAIGQNAAGIAADYGGRIASVGQAGAAAQGGYLTTGTTPVAEGRAAVIAQTTAQQQQALAQGESAALQGTGQELTAQNQLQTGLNNAGALAAPQVTTPGQAVFNPVTGTYTSASSGGGQPATAPSGIDQGTWNQYIQDYASGNMGAIPSAITGNPNLSGQLQQAVKAQNPNFNYNTAVGTGQAAQSNAQVSGTAQTGAAASGYGSAVQNYVSANTAYTTASSQATNLQQTMASTGINSNPKFANNKIINFRTSSVQRTTLRSSLH